MEKKYAKINNSEKIYNVISESKDYVILCYQNKHLKILKDKVNFIQENITPTFKYNVEIQEKNFNNEIMLRHMTEYEAYLELDRFISKAINLKIPMIKIIHGRHGNVLKNVVDKYLTASEYIESFHLASVYDGDSGVTIAYLKKLY